MDPQFTIQETETGRFFTVRRLNDNAAVGPTVDLLAHPLPVQVTFDKFLNALSNVVQASNRDYHNLALKADGSLWLWGVNDQGQCGDGTTNVRPSPPFAIPSKTCEL